MKDRDDLEYEIQLEWLAVLIQLHDRYDDGWVPVAGHNWARYRVGSGKGSTRRETQLTDWGWMERRQGHGGKDPQATSFRVTDLGRRAFDIGLESVDPGRKDWLVRLSTWEDQ